MAIIDDDQSDGWGIEASEKLTLQVVDVEQWIEADLGILDVGWSFEHMTTLVAEVLKVF